MAKKFICSDESINCYGFRVLTKGIDMRSFKKNPVGFLNHNTGGSFWGTDPNYSGPIIRWEGLEKDADQLLGTPVFDVNDEFGKKINDKVESDFIRAASIGFRIVETSSDPELMLPGQTRPTVTKCELIEISVVDIPANKNALALFDADNNRIELNDEAISTTLSAVLKTNKPSTQHIMKLKIEKAWTGLLSLLGLEVPEGSQNVEAEISAEKLADINDKVNKLGEVQAQLTAKEGELATLNAELTSLKNANATLTTQKEALTAEVATLKAEAEQLRKPAEAPAHPHKKEESQNRPADEHRELTDEEKRAELLKFDVKNVSLNDEPFFVTQ